MKFYILFLSLFCLNTFFAQRYTDAIGLRFANVGFTQLNGKHFMNANSAIELSLGGNANYVWLQGNYEWQDKLTKDVDFYVGAGPGFGFVSGKPILGNASSDRYMFGLNGIFGAEYTLPDYPFTFSVETGPFVQIIPSAKLGWNFGIAARYVLR